METSTAEKRSYTCIKLTAQLHIQKFCQFSAVHGSDAVTILHMQIVNSYKEFCQIFKYGI